MSRELRRGERLVGSKNLPVSEHSGQFVVMLPVAYEAEGTSPCMVIVDKFKRIIDWEYLETVGAFPGDVIGELAKPYSPESTEDQVIMQSK